MSGGCVALDGLVAVADGRRVKLSPAEAKVLARLIRAGGSTVLLATMDDVLHGADAARPKSNVAQVVLCRLRQKLEAFPGHRIESIRGVGYRLHLPAGPQA